VLFCVYGFESGKIVYFYICCGGKICGWFKIGWVDVLCGLIKCRLCVMLLSYYLMGMYEFWFGVIKSFDCSKEIGYCVLIFWCLSVVVVFVLVIMLCWILLVLIGF